MIRYLRPLSAAFALAALLSCATGGYAPQAPSMPAARAALRPEYRIFYDALQDYGDWVLIEPYGFVFHPKVDFATFRPYQDGFWAPTDAWGWVWISAEPFGWATYHYGSWLWDRFQGWVWRPGIDWGPAWVDWQLTDGYAGWAPLSASGGPSGDYLYVPLERMGATDLGAHVTTRERLGDRVAGAQPVNNVVVQDGVRIHRGPSLALVERIAGPLRRVKLEETVAGAPATGGREATPGGDPAVVDVEATKRAAEENARRARTLIDTRGQTPAVMHVLRPLVIPPASDEAAGRKRVASPRRPGAVRDTAR